MTIKTERRSPKNIRLPRKNYGIYIAAFAVGFIGGPISALSATLCIFLIIRYYKDCRRYSDRYMASPMGRCKTLIVWFLIGLVAMPVTWIVANSLGWNFDPVAIIQSRGNYKSYKDWREHEEASAKKEYERFKEEWKNNIESARQQREIEAKSKYQTELHQEKEEKKKEIYEPDDPLPLLSREEYRERHYRFLDSIGCIDQDGNTIKTFSCLNTQEPVD